MSGVLAFSKIVRLVEARLTTTTSGRASPTRSPTARVWGAIIDSGLAGWKSWRLSKRNEPGPGVGVEDPERAVESVGDEQVRAPVVVEVVDGEVGGGTAGGVEAHDIEGPVRHGPGVAPRGHVPGMAVDAGEVELPVAVEVGEQDARRRGVERQRAEGHLRVAERGVEGRATGEAGVGKEIDGVGQHRARAGRQAGQVQAAVGLPVGELQVDRGGDDRGAFGRVDPLGKGHEGIGPERFVAAGGGGEGGRTRGTRPCARRR